MNVCILSGRLQWRPELRYQSSGKPELSFRLTVPNGERDGTQFYLPYDITVYGSQCEPLAEALDEGDLVELNGSNTRPKLPTKPGMKPIPAAICFHVTRLSGSASGEHEAHVEYQHEGAEPIVEPEPTSAAPTPKARRPRYPRVTKQPWVASRLASSEN